MNSYFLVKNILIPLFYKYDGKKRILTDYLHEYKGYAKKEGVTISYGASRAAVIDEVNKIVFKIPFKGYDEKDRYSGAGYTCTEDSWNYCESEKSIYKEAKKYRVEDFFLPVQTIENINYPFYAQKLVEVLASNENYLSSSGYDKGSSDFDIPNYFLDKMYNYYGKDSVDDFINFSFDIGLNDIHDENIGYINGRPVIFDYAGFDS